MTREFNVIIEKDEDGYFVASVPALRGCHTQAKSLDVLMKRVKEAIELCLEVEEPVSNEFIGIQRVWDLTRLTLVQRHFTATTVREPTGNWMAGRGETGNLD